ncbi:unnamed protein product [Menidia menidia]|uniref:(Atlantic silverside) hypothetical protein n=1 Tax=Menidia menidia TaxID=238744 RepID=A0A8S4AI87_9TELE|nr:unnamed protein product [Menidia menidia]
MDYKDGSSFIFALPAGITAQSCLDKRKLWSICHCVTHCQDSGSTAVQREDEPLAATHAHKSQSKKRFTEGEKRGERQDESESAGVGQAGERARLPCYRVHVAGGDMVSEEDKTHILIMEDFLLSNYKLLINPPIRLSLSLSPRPSPPLLRVSGWLFFLCLLLMKGRTKLPSLCPCVVGGSKELLYRLRKGITANASKDVSSRPVEPRQSLEPREIPRSAEPCAAVGPEMNAQYSNLAYLVLSLHPVGSTWQHNREQEQKLNTRGAVITPLIEEESTPSCQMQQPFPSSVRLHLRFESKLYGQGSGQTQELVERLAHVMCDAARR